MRPLTMVLGAAALMLGLLAAPTGSAHAAPAPAKPAGEQRSESLLRPAAAPAKLKRLERKVVAKTNRARSRHGCKPLKKIGSLRQAARRHTALMVRHRRLDHRLPGEPSLSGRIAKAGYRGADVVGENLALGARTPRAVVRAWLRSSGHRANILDCRFRHIGVGVVNARGERWWTQTFGRR